MEAHDTVANMLAFAIVVAVGYSMCSNDDDDADMEKVSDSPELDTVQQDRAELAHLTRKLVRCRVGDVIKMTNFQRLPDGTTHLVRSTHEVVANNMWVGLHLRGPVTTPETQVWKFNWLGLSAEQIRAREIKVLSRENHTL